MSAIDDDDDVVNESDDAVDLVNSVAFGAMIDMTGVANECVMYMDHELEMQIDSFFTWILTLFLQ